LIVSDKPQFHAAKWLPNSIRMPLMAYKAAADDDAPPSLDMQEMIKFLTSGGGKCLEVVEQLRVQSPALHEEFQALLKESRALLAGHLVSNTGEGMPRSLKVAGGVPSPRMVSTIVQILDLALDPKKADGVIGDLLEQYPRRLAFGPGHAKRWLVAQTVRVLFGRALDVIRQVAAARAGKGSSMARPASGEGMKAPLKHDSG
jgi:hypothetical protein